MQTSSIITSGRLIDTSVQFSKAGLNFQFAMGGHKKGMVANHECCDGNTHYVMLEPQVMADSLDVDLKKDLKVMPVKYGSLLLFNNVIPHRR